MFVYWVVLTSFPALLYSCNFTFHNYLGKKHLLYSEPFIMSLVSLKWWTLTFEDIGELQQRSFNTWALTRDRTHTYRKVDFLEGLRTPLVMLAITARAEARKRSQTTRWTTQTAPCSFVHQNSTSQHAQRGQGNTWCRADQVDGQCKGICVGFE